MLLMTDKRHRGHFHFCRKDVGKPLTKSIPDFSILCSDQQIWKIFPGNKMKKTWIPTCFFTLNSLE